jgi:hypothetical protein
MGRQIIWDGRGLPEVGDEVLFEIGSSPAVQTGTVDRFEVVRYDKEKLNSWRIEVHMTCRSSEGSWPQMRLLEDVRPITHKGESS